MKKKRFAGRVFLKEEKFYDRHKEITLYEVDNYLKKLQEVAYLLDENYSLSKKLNVLLIIVLIIIFVVG